ncbi:DNA-processing protein DprA [Mycoplasmopsis agalactiae]|uniref:DNA-processing protein DprA n=1 Tax=Mycoplasmopsis agalactiae TaxID=2110 RepID=UPI001F2BDD5F|nr:DNA-processing protein DprA [Mycoplasmopsis agalactiae]MCE6115280.1 DNA-processing protein DprA [Mycoplasmopsis agalactiae]
MNDLLVYFSILFKGNNFEIYKALKNGYKVDKYKVDEEINKLKESGIKTITIFDTNYPQGLKELKYSPFVLFYKGNIKLLNKNIVCATGDVANEFVLHNVVQTCNELAKNTILLTNNFKNIDQNIIEIFNNNKQGIIYLLANGISYNCPDVDFNKDLCITFIPPDLHPKLRYFKERNVVASALANNLIIFSSKRNSGLINLANCFANLGKNVYCYPGLTYDDGNTYLIKSGASLITHLAEVNYF